MIDILNPTILELNGSKILGIAMAAVLWFARGRVKVWDDHVASCVSRNENDAAKDAHTASEVEHLKERVNEVRRDQVWIGDCIVAIGSHVGADVPKRPS